VRRPPINPKSLHPGLWIPALSHSDPPPQIFARRRMKGVPRTVELLPKGITLGGLAHERAALSRGPAPVEMPSLRDPSPEVEKVAYREVRVCFSM
jgi:hypothetical protein